MERSISTIVTTEEIKKICVKLGFYRNPVCNEKLYLHNKGFDRFEEDAFDPYTDVKVLWLEGNAFSFIPCGKDSLPRKKKQERPTLHVQENRPIDLANIGCSKSAQREISGNLHVDPCTEWINPSIDTSDAGEEKEEISNANSNIATVTTTVIEDAKKDVFQSLYPTLRQLFLHNNALREMPDISKFERLDTINLSFNCIHSVRANCSAFNEREDEYKQAIQNKKCACLLNLKCKKNELCVSKVEENTGAVEEKTNPCDECDSFKKQRGLTPLPDNSATAAGTACCDESRMNISQDEKLDMWRQLLNEYATFCPHEPLDEAENGRLFNDVPPERLNPCSSIRTLNLSNNYLSNTADILELLCFKNLATLDLSYNQLSDGEALLLVLQRMPRLRSLKLSGNPLVRQLPRYRKRVLACCKELLHLDESPVFADERRLVTAWVRGGDEEEKKERALMKQELEEQHLRRLREFRAVVGRYSNANANNANVPGNARGSAHASPQGGLLTGPATRGMELRQPHGAVNDGFQNNTDDVTSSEEAEEEQRGGANAHHDEHQDNRGNGILDAERNTASNVFEIQEGNQILPSGMPSGTQAAQETLFVTSSVSHANAQQQQRQHIEHDDEEDTDAGIYIPSAS